MADVRMRPTTPADVPWVCALEADPDVRPYIHAWAAELHNAAIADPTKAHWVAEAVESGRPVGFAILANVHEDDVELVRIVTARRGQGLGRILLRRVRDVVFHEWRANRLWLDVYPFNERARRLYESEGFLPAVPARRSNAPSTNGPRGPELIVLQLLAGSRV